MYFVMLLNMSFQHNNAPLIEHVTKACMFSDKLKHNELSLVNNAKKIKRDYYCYIGIFLAWWTFVILFDVVFIVLALAILYKLHVMY